MGLVHDSLVDLIYGDLASKYDDVSQHVCYSRGELDILLIEGRRAIIIEIKSSNKKKNRTRAYQQLLTACNNYYAVKTKEFYGFYCYWTDKSHTKYGIERLI